VELLYSRQSTELSDRRVGSPRLTASVERYMAGLEEEKGDDRIRYIGVALLGLTRFDPGFAGYGADELFTLGLSLGLKVPLSNRLGVRAEARGFFVTTYGSAGAFCRNRACLFSYSASGLWQGDVSASLVVALGRRPADPSRRRDGRGASGQSGFPIQEYCQATDAMR
jgi:hypothetical protein